MPELPDITVYVDCLRKRMLGKRLVRIRLLHPFLLRTVEPPLTAFEGAEVQSIDRLGKRIVFEVGHDRFLVLHLMIAGRLLWKEPGAALAKKVTLAALELEEGQLVLTEAGSKRRATLHAELGRDSLKRHDPGGLEALGSSLEQLAAALRKENRTLKRALTDPRLISGIGNSYSDEILHAARLSPVVLTHRLTDEAIHQLHRAVNETLSSWTKRLKEEVGEGFPTKVTAFRPDMAVHGRFGKPCLVCATAVQRIVHAENESNYCPRCQTGGKLLADRSLSRLLHDDWPKTIEELEELRANNSGSR